MSDDDDGTRLRFDHKTSKLIKSLVARNAKGDARPLDPSGEWHLANEHAPWSLLAEIKLPIRFGVSIVLVELDVPPGLHCAKLSVGLFPPRIFFVEYADQAKAI